MGRRSFRLGFWMGDERGVGGFGREDIYGGREIDSYFNATDWYV